MKKTLLFFLSIIIILSTLTPAFGAPSQKDIYNKSGKTLKDTGVLQGSETGDLMLNQKLKRQDMAVLMSRLYKEESTAKKYSTKDIFKDVNSKFYKPYIYWALDKGLIIGISPDTFGFNKLVTVEQFQIVLLRSLGYGEEAKDLNNVDNFSKALGLMEGLSTTPKQTVERGLMAAMTVNALKLITKGSSMTLAQKLNISLPGSFNVNSTATVDKKILKLEGTATGVNELKVSIKPISNKTSTEEIVLDISLKEDSKFIIEIPNLEKGKYEYKFISGNHITETKSITIE